MSRAPRDPRFSRIRGKAEQYIYKPVGYAVSRRERDRAIKNSGYIPKPVRALAVPPAPAPREVAPRTLEQRSALADWFLTGTAEARRKQRHYYNPNTGIEITRREYEKLRRTPGYVPMPAPDNVPIDANEKRFWSIVREYALNHKMSDIAEAARSEDVASIIAALQSDGNDVKGRKADALRKLGRKRDFTWDVGETPDA